MLLAAAAAAALVTAASSSPEPACIPYVNMAGGDLADMPIKTASSASCRAKCDASAQCVLYTYIDPRSPMATNCHATATEGCCWLKSEEVGGVAPKVWDEFACSEWRKVPPQQWQAARPKKHHLAGKGKRNVLYIAVDDLRTELEAYGQNFTHNPNIKKLSETGLTFDNAYCQISVCSPSRLSFLTGRRPDHAGMYNFINHFRQADCGISEANVEYSADANVVPPIDTSRYGGGCQWGGGQTQQCGGSGQCCSLCTEFSNCTHWSYAGKMCSLKGGDAGDLSAVVGAVSGFSGTSHTHSKWTSHPQAFKNAGYLALQTGKIFHTEEGGVGNTDPNLNGPGMPPNSDPPSWSDGLFMPQVNAVANMFGTAKNEILGVNATLEGVLLDPAGDVEKMKSAHQLCDRVVSSDAVGKLRLASMNLNATGQPFFLATGFRKPHLAFRFPAPFKQFLPHLAKIKTAEHPVLNADVPPIAHCDKSPQENPYNAVSATVAQQWRLTYYGAIAWVDSQIGRVLNELDALGLSSTTLVVLHADHGWSLGEHGEWQKFSNFEHGTRVPLIIRAPWITASIGKRTSVLAELIDVFPTVIDLMDVETPSGETLDGTSLASIFEDPSDRVKAKALKPYAMSQYMRCPKGKNLLNASLFWKANDCLFTDRVLIPFMGYTLRTPEYRFTEWTKWNGTTLTPDHTAEGLVGVELYRHDDSPTSPAWGLEYSFDHWENENLAAANPEVVKELTALLHSVQANETRIASFTPPFRG